MAKKVVKWQKSVPNSAGTGTDISNRVEVYDTDYGKCTPETGGKVVKSPFKLAILKGGQYLVGSDAYAEVQNIPLNLPIITKIEPETIVVSNWKKLSEGSPEEGDLTLFRTRKWRINHWEEYPYSSYNSFWWNFAGVEEYLVKGNSETMTVSNPAYPVYLEKLVQIKQALQSTFILMGTYQFPGLPYSSNYRWWEGDSIATLVEIIPLDPNHPLSMLIEGWKLLLKPMPINDQLHSSLWDGFIMPNLLSVDFLKKVLGI